jgi:hypothetical protein
MQNEEKIKKQNSLYSEINIEMGVTKTRFQCYKREFVKGEKVGNPFKSSLFGKSVGVESIEKRIKKSAEVIKNRN